MPDITDEMIEAGADALDEWLHGKADKIEGVLAIYRAMKAKEPGPVVRQDSCTWPTCGCHPFCGDKPDPNIRTYASNNSLPPPA